MLILLETSMDCQPGILKAQPTELQILKINDLNISL